MGKSIFEKLGLVESSVDTTDSAAFDSDIEDRIEDAEFESLTSDLPAIQVNDDKIDIEAVFEEAKSTAEQISAVTIYTIQDMLDSLPYEMPQKTKKATLKNLMNTLGYDVEQIKKDAEFRKTLLQRLNHDKEEALQGELESNVNKIEELKLEIEQMSVRNNDITSAVETNKMAVDEAVRSIDYTLTFIEEGQE